MRQATLTVASNDPLSPVQVALEGTGGELPQGVHGASGAPGAPGKQGARGERGEQGPQGEPGQVRLVTCRIVKTAGKAKRRCRTRVTTGTATVKTRARASLTRRGVLYATGSARPGSLRLVARRQLRAGRYTLTLRSGHDTTRRTIRIR
jgi:hypothetical protein